MRALLICAVLLLSAHALGAPVDSLHSGELCSLTLLTGPDTAWVFIDSCRLGSTPLTIDTLRAGRHLLRLLQADLGSWLGDAIRDTIVLAPSQRRTLRYAFERRVMVITDPSGALVYVGDSLAGATPLVLSSRAHPLPESVEAREKGFATAIIPLPRGGSGIARVVLEKTWQSEAPESPLADAYGSTERTRLRLYVAGVATVASGVMAAYFKIKADTRNSLYLAGGDPRLQDETHRFDNAAALALIATEIGFAFFTYFLLSD